MKIILKRFLIVTFSISMMACTKKANSMNGTNTVVYTRSYEDHFEIQTAPMLQTEVFIIGEVNVYQDAMGQLAYSAFNGSTNGKADWVKDATISELKLSEYLEVGLSNDNSNLSSNLVNCQLFFTYYPTDNSGEKKVLLANFVEYKSSGQKVILQPTGNDLTSLFKEQVVGGQLRLEFKFASTPHTVGNMRLWYRLPFNYSYTYSSKAAKKKE